MTTRATSFDTEHFDQETVETASSRVGRILASDQTNQPAATEPPAAVQQPLTPAPANSTALAADAPSTDGAGRKPRTTVGRLLQGYKDREAETDKIIASIKAEIASKSGMLAEMESRKIFLRELIDQIESD